MTTNIVHENDMTHEMKKILTILFNAERGNMETEQIARNMELRHQEAKYFMEKLQKKELVRIGVSSIGVVEYCALTADGRAYVMEKM